MTRRVVITGLGIVTPVGNDIATSWAQCLKGVSGVGLITRFDTTPYPVKIAAEVKNFYLGNLLDTKEASRASTFVQYATSAAHQAMKDSGIEAEVQADQEFSEKFGCVIGVGLGGLENIEDATLALNSSERGYRRVSPFFLPYAIPNIAAGVVSKNFNLRGPNMCTTTACTSGTHAVGEGFLYIQAGMADAMLVGGTESTISKLGINCFAVMKALSTRNDNPSEASRPFDRDRDGFVMGEGSGMLVLEEYDHAKKRGAKIYAELSGYGMSGDAYHITSPAPEGEGAARCMKASLNCAKVSPSDVDYINAHGTSTELNDSCESAAIGAVFKVHASKLSISSTKGVTGHCLGAAGGIEAVFTALAIYHQVVPPTANFTTRDPLCPWDYTPKTKEKRIKVAISNSFGFGGTNASITLKKFN